MSLNIVFCPVVRVEGDRRLYITGCLRCACQCCAPWCGVVWCLPVTVTDYRHTTHQATVKLIVQDRKTDFQERSYPGQVGFPWNIGRVRSHLICDVMWIPQFSFTPKLRWQVRKGRNPEVLQIFARTKSHSIGWFFNTRVSCNIFIFILLYYANPRYQEEKIYVGFEKTLK